MKQTGILTELPKVNKKARRRFEYVDDPAVDMGRGILTPSATPGQFGGADGSVQQPGFMDSSTIQNLADRSPTFGAILRLRTGQAMAFAKRPLFDGDSGFDIVPRDNQHRQMSPAEIIEANKIADFLLQTGIPHDYPTERDTLRRALYKMITNSLVFDALPVELVRDELGKLKEFIVLDGSSVNLVDPEKWKPQTPAGKLMAPIRYVQSEMDKVVAEWHSSEMLFAIRNPSAYLGMRGYGDPEINHLVKMITIEINVTTYANRQISQGSMPDGLIVVKSNRPNGDTDEIFTSPSQQGNEDFQRGWRNEFSGPENAGKVGMLQLGIGEDAQFFNNTRTPRDMQFIEMLEVAQNIICAWMNVEPSELSMVMGSLKESSFIDSDARSSRIRLGRSKGLVNLLGFIADEILNPIIWRMNPNFSIMWRGIDLTEEQDRLNYEVEMLKNGVATLNEIRTIKNLPRYEQWWADYPINLVMESLKNEPALVFASPEEAEKGGLLNVAQQENANGGNPKPTNKRPSNSK